MSTDLWPHTLQQDATDLETGERYTQSLAVLSVGEAIAKDLIEPDHLSPDLDAEELAMLMVVDSNDAESGGAVITGKDDLLEWALGLVTRLADDLGPMRAQEVIDEVGCGITLTAKFDPSGDPGAGQA